MVVDLYCSTNCTTNCCTNCSALLGCWAAVDQLRAGGLGGCSPCPPQGVVSRWSGRLLAGGEAASRRSGRLRVFFCMGRHFARHSCPVKKLQTRGRELPIGDQRKWPATPSAATSTAPCMVHKGSKAHRRHPDAVMTPSNAQEILQATRLSSRCAVSLPLPWAH